MKGLWAVALLTLREGSRSRGLPVLWALFAAALLGIHAASASQIPEERFRALLGTGGQMAHGILVLSAVLMGALAHPQELRQRTLQTLFAKPLRRGTYLAGKCLGLTLLLLILAGILGATSCAAIAMLPDLGSRSVRVLLEPMARMDGIWRFRPSADGAPRALEVRLAMGSPPASLTADLRGPDGLSLQVPLSFNAAGEGQAILPLTHFQAPGPLEIRLPLPPVQVADVTLLTASTNYPLLIGQALLADGCQAAALCALALAASTVLSAPVTLFLALGMTALAHGHPLIQDLERLLTRPPSGTWAVRTAAPPRGLLKGLRALNALTPDFSGTDLCAALDRAEMPARRPRAIGRWVFPRGHPLAWTGATCLLYAGLYLALGLAGVAFAELK